MNPTAQWDGVAWRVAVTLLHFLWQGLLVYAVWRVVLPTLRRASVRYVWSLAGLLALAICPLWTFSELPAQSTATPAFVEALDDSGAVAASDWLESAALASDNSAQRWSWHAWVVLAWTAGVGLLGLRLLAGCLSLAQFRRDLQPLTADTFPALRHWSARLQSLVAGRLYATERVKEAIVVGFFRPLILIPAAWLTEMPAEMLEGVVAHEVAHIRRFDLWINLLQRLLETVLFYHPVVWLISKHARWEREMCCDEMAVAATGQRLAYVDALRWVASRHVGAPRPALTAAILGDRKMRLLTRVRNVLQLEDGRQRGSWWAVGLLALALPLSALVVANGQDGERDKKQRRERAERVERAERAELAERKAIERRDRDRAARANRDHRADFERSRRSRDERQEREHAGRRREEERDRDRDHARREREQDRERSSDFRRRRAEEEVEIDRNRNEWIRREDRRVVHNDDLVALISELKKEVMNLRREVQALRQERGEAGRRLPQERRLPQDRPLRGAELERFRNQWKKSQTDLFDKRKEDGNSARRRDLGDRDRAENVLKDVRRFDEEAAQVRRAIEATRRRARDLRRDMPDESEAPRRRGREGTEARDEVRKEVRRDKAEAAESRKDKAEAAEARAEDRKDKAEAAEATEARESARKDRKEDKPESGF